MVKLEQIKQAFNEMQIALGKNDSAKASEKRGELYALCDLIEVELTYRKQNGFFPILLNGVTHSHVLGDAIEAIKVSSDRAEIFSNDRWVVYNLNNLAGFTVTFED